MVYILPQHRNQRYISGLPRHDELLQGSFIIIYLSVCSIHLKSSHDTQAGSVVTQLAFSPKASLLAWTDTNGVFSRWTDPLPDGFPDPVRQAISTTSADIAPMKPKTGPALFGDPVPDDDTVNLDMPEGFEDDWLVDDLGTGLRDDPHPKDKLVKEMGVFLMSITFLPR